MPLREEVVDCTARRSRQRFVHFVAHAHTLPSMLAVALAPDGELDRMAAAGFAAAAQWSDAVRRTAS